MKTYTIKREELHRAWADVDYEVTANSKKEALAKLDKYPADGVSTEDINIAFFVFDDFEPGPAVSVEPESSIEVL